MHVGRRDDSEEWFINKASRPPGPRSTPKWKDGRKAGQEDRQKAGGPAQSRR